MAMYIKLGWKRKMELGRMDASARIRRTHTRWELVLLMPAITTLTVCPLNQNSTETQRWWKWSRGWETPLFCLWQMKIPQTFPIFGTPPTALFLRCYMWIPQNRIKTSLQIVLFHNSISVVIVVSIKSTSNTVSSRTFVCVRFPYPSIHAPPSLTPPSVHLQMIFRTSL